MKDKELRQALKDAGIFYDLEYGHVATRELVYTLGAGVDSFVIKSMTDNIKRLQEQVEMLLNYLNVREVEAHKSLVDKEEE